MPGCRHPNASALGPLPRGAVEATFVMTAPTVAAADGHGRKPTWPVDPRSSLVISIGRAVQPAPLKEDVSTITQTQNISLSMSLETWRMQIILTNSRRKIIAENYLDTRS